jgi:hypothetical protein
VHMATHGVKRLAMPRIGEPPTTINTMTTTAWRAQATASALTCVNDTTLRFPLIGQNGIIFIASLGQTRWVYFDRSMGNTYIRTVPGRLLLVLTLLGCSFRCWPCYFNLSSCWFYRLFLPFVVAFFKSILAGCCRVRAGWAAVERLEKRCGNDVFLRHSALQTADYLPGQACVTVRNSWQKGTLLGVFPMFVPSLSWLNVRFYT